MFSFGPGLKVQNKLSKMVAKQFSQPKISVMAQLKSKTKKYKEKIKNLSVKRSRQYDRIRNQMMKQFYGSGGTRSPNFQMTKK